MCLAWLRCPQALAAVPNRDLLLEHLVLQWEYGDMTSEALDRCLQTIREWERKLAAGRDSR